MEQIVQYTNSFNFSDTLGLFLLILGFIFGLGAVTVIDIHGFLARKSTYWTEATIRTHKVTKPMIWVGISLVTIGGLIFYSYENLTAIPTIHNIVVFILILNGIFLSFKVSPFLIQREARGESREILPKNWQNKIIISFIISDLGWFTALVLLVIYITKHLS